MFENLTDRLGSIFDKITKRGTLRESDINEAMSEVRRALIEADVAVHIVRSFTDKVRARALGAEVVKSVTPGQMVVKIVHDQLVEMLGSDAKPLDLEAVAPVPIMMVGLQGSGKTTSAAKIARRLTQRENKKVLMASLDTNRPAAQEQLKVLGEQNNIDTLPIIANQSATEIAARSMNAARVGGYDAVILDTAGRTHIDEPLMQEMEEIKNISKPHEILLVVDSLTGQDAVNLAKSFDEQVGISGIVLTRMDGDGRGGAALSMHAVTGKPVKLLGTGEKVDALEDFHPERIAGRILGMGDIVSLVESASEKLDEEKAQEIAERLEKGQFTLEDYAEQIKQMTNMGGIKNILGLMPGFGKVKKQLNSLDIDETVFNQQLAIISSMTPFERHNPRIMNAKRKIRIANGSGTRVQDVNRLLQMSRKMHGVIKQFSGSKGGLMGNMAKLMGMNNLEGMSEENLNSDGQMPELPPGGMPNLPGGLPGGLPAGLPAGLTGGLPSNIPGMPGGGGFLNSKMTHGPGKRKKKRR